MLKNIIRKIYVKTFNERHLYVRYHGEVAKIFIQNLKGRPIENEVGPNGNNLSTFFFTLHVLVER